MKFLVILALALLSLAGLGQGIGKKYPLISLAQVATTPYDTFRITATVKDIYVCPPCPKGADCKPCVGDHLTVGASGVSRKNQLRVLTSTPTQFKKESIYLFLVKRVNKAHPEFGTMLIASEPQRK